MDPDRGRSDDGVAKASLPRSAIPTSGVGTTIGPVAVGYGDVRPSETRGA